MSRRSDRLPSTLRPLCSGRRLAGEPARPVEAMNRCSMCSIFSPDALHTGAVTTPICNVMERMRVPAAFTSDRHFAQYGFTALTAM